MNITDGNDDQLDLSLSDAEGDIGDDVIDPDQVIPDSIIVNINDWNLCKGERFAGEVPNIAGSDFEVYQCNAQIRKPLEMVKEGGQDFLQLVKYCPVNQLTSCSQNTRTVFIW